MFGLAQVTSSGSMFFVVLVALVLGLLLVGLMIFLFVLWVMMLIDALTRTDWRSDDERMVWTIVLILSLFVQLWGITAVVYYYVIKQPRKLIDKKYPEAEIVAKTSTQKLKDTKRAKAKPKK
jgi:predicted membrane protein